MAQSEITVKVHLDMELNGEPITQILEAPAQMEEMERHEGLVVHLHVDAAKLAAAISESLKDLYNR